MSTPEFQAAILLGGIVNLDGTLNPPEQKQVQKAVNLYHSGEVEYLIPCGAHGFKEDQPPILTQAEGYSLYSQELGVPGDRIILEDQSKDTIGNLYFAKKILITRGWLRVAIIPAVNQLDERVEYVTRKVLGPKYEWKIKRAEAENRRPANVARELRSLHSTQGFIDGFKDGDHEAVYAKLCETHPAYGGSQPLEELKAYLSA